MKDFSTSGTSYHLVHANVALARACAESPIMASFFEIFDAIGLVASRSPGFVMQPIAADSGEVYQGNQFLNLSIWESVESLQSFTYSGEHVAALRNRSEWFEKSTGPGYVLFWNAAGEIPTELEISKRMAHLAKHGATPHAFDFNQSFSAEEAQARPNQRGI